MKKIKNKNFIDIQLFTLTILTFLTIGCTSTKRIYDNTNFKLSNSSQSNIVGTYLNRQMNFDKSNSISDSLNGPSYLWNYLSKDKFNYKNNLKYSDSSKVVITKINRNRFEAKLIDKYNHLKPLKLRGKINTKNYTLKRKVFVIPIPFIFYIYSEKLVILSKSDESFLIAKKESYSFAWIIIAADSRNYTEHKFQEIKK